MTIQPLSLIHLVRAPDQPVPGTTPLLLLLHGIGSNEADLMGLAPYLDGRFLVVSARAPLTLMRGAYAWYHMQLTPSGPVGDAQGAERSRVGLSRFIDELVEAYDVDPGRVYLMGFSQGAIMGLAVTLTQPEKVSGLVAMSGRLLPEVRAMTAPPEKLRGLPIFVAHGLADAVLPIDNGREINNYLATLPVALTYREYPMGHEVSAESLGDIAAWLSERLDGE